MEMDDIFSSQNIGSSGSLFVQKVSSRTPSEPSQQRKKETAFEKTDTQERGGIYDNTFGKSQGSNVDLILMPLSTGNSETSLAGQREVQMTKSVERLATSPSPSENAEMVETYATSLQPRVHDRRRRSLQKSDDLTSRDVAVSNSDVRRSDANRRHQTYQERLSSSFDDARSLSGDSHNRYRIVERAIEEQLQDDRIIARNRTLSEPISSLKLLMVLSEDENPNTSQRLHFEDTVDQRHDHQSNRRSLPLQSASQRQIQPAINRFSAAGRSSGMASSGIMPWDPRQSTAFSLQAEADSRHDDNHDHEIAQRPRPSLTYLGEFTQERIRAMYHLNALDAIRARMPADPHHDLKSLNYTSWIPRLHRLLLPLIIYAHVFITIFFDYNTLYSIIQVALYPDSSNASTAWWIAIGIYSAFLIVWVIGVLIIWELLFQYYRQWLRSRPFALPIYLSSSAYNLSSIRSFALYSLLYRARLSATRRDFIIETFWFYSQNWPTVFTLLPRGVILSIFLVLYNPIRPSSITSGNVQDRDSVYFDTRTGALTNFSFVILLLNAIWMAWRVMVLLLSYLGLWITLGPKALFEQEYTRFDSYDWSPKKRFSGLDNEEAVTFEMLARETDVLSRQDNLGQVDESDLLRSLQLPRLAWRGRAEERLKALLRETEADNVDPSNTRSESAVLDVAAQHGEEVLDDVEQEMKRMYSDRRQPWTISEEIAAASGSSSRASHSLDRLRSAPRLFISGDSSVLSSIMVQDQLPISSNPSDEPTAKGKEKRNNAYDSADPSSIDEGIFTSHQRPTSDMTISSILSSATVRPTFEGNQGNIERSSMCPFPTESGNLTPTMRDDTGRMARTQRASLEPMTSDTVIPTSTALAASSSILTEKKRANSSLTSLSESLRFGKGSKSADDLREDHLPMSMRVRGEAAWWSIWRKGKFREESVPLELDEEKDNQMQQYAEEVGAEEGEMEELASIPAQSEQNSLHTHDTNTSEDSEEKRLWSQFPEQSRRYPPGLIALELEQRQLSQPQDSRVGSSGSRYNALAQEEVETPRKSGELLVPIKEESWSNSIESTSNDSQ